MARLDLDLGLFRDLFFEFDEEIDAEQHVPIDAFFLLPTTAPDGSFNAIGMAYLLALLEDPSDATGPPIKRTRTRAAHKDPQSTAWWSDYVVDASKTYRDRKHKHGSCLWR
jgi:hypothetical protein